MPTGSRRSFARRGVSVFLLSLLLAVPALAQKTSDGDPDAPKAQPTQSIYRDDPAARAKWFMRGRAIKGENPALLLQRAFRQKMKMRQSLLQQFQQQMQTMQAGGATASATTQSATQGASLLSMPAWQNLGPAPISGEAYGDTSGRITALAVDPCDASGNTVLAGGAYGGVWKSTNAAASDPTTVTWAPLYDTDPAAATLTVGAISLGGSCSGTNSQVILVGTGEPNNAGDSYYGMGILRSNDGGSSWTLLSTADSGARSLRGIGFGRFAWSSASFVVAAGAVTPLGNEFDLVSLSGSGSDFYWSNDAGATWHSSTSVMDGGTATAINRVYDVAWNAVANKFFGVMRYHGVYQSGDGQNWTRMSSQPGLNLTTTNCPASTSTACPIYRGTLAVKPGANETYLVWTSVNNTTGADALGGVARSLDGNTWTTITTTGLTTCGDPAGCAPQQGFYNQFITAVANSSNTDVYIGFINVWRCTLPSTGTSGLCNSTTANAPNRFNNLTHVYGSPGFGGTCSSSYRTIHPDEHAVAVAPGHAQIMYFGNDGGVYRSLTAQTGLTHGTCTATDSNPFQDLNTPSLGSISQFVSISQHPTDPTVILGGTQDNGSPGMATGDGQTSGTDWFEANGGDGGYNEIDQTNPVNWYTTNTDVSIQKCVGGTNAGPFNPSDACIKTDFFNSIVGPTQVGGDHGAFYTPYILDPANQANIIVGTCRVWRGGTTGSNLTVIGPDFEPGGSTPCSGNETNVVRSLAAGGTPVSGVSPVIYAGTDGFSGSLGGRIWATTNANIASPTWNDTTGAINPGGFPISSIAIDRTVASGQTAYITIMGFTGNPNGAGHLFKTSNAGASWTDIGVGLPDSPADSIAIDPNSSQTLYVGTDVGVFFTTNGGTSWQEYGTGLPNVAALALRVFNSGGVQKLRVGTHGRGVWQVDLASPNDFSITTGTPVATVRPGGTANWPVTVAKTGSFAGSVTMSCNPNPPATGTSCSISPNPADLSAASSVPVTLNVPTTNGSTAIGDYAFNLHGTDGAALNHDLALTLRVNDFALGSATAPQTIQQTGSGTYSVTLTPNGNFSDPITLSCANFSSSGMSCQFSQNPVTPGLSATPVTVTVNAAANASVASNQTFNVVGNGDGTQHSVQLGYSTILVQDFTFTGNTTSQTVLGGNTANFSGTLTPLNSFSASNMTVGCTGLPAGAQCQFNPAAPSISAATPLPITINVTTTAGTTPAGNYPITATVTDQASGKTHNIQLSLTVQDFTVAVSPTSRTVAVGAGTTYNVTVTGQNGFTGSVSLACGTLPANVSCSSFSATSVNASPTGTSVTLTALTTSSVTTGAKTIPVTGTASGQTRSVNATMTVSSTQPSFNLTISPSTRAIQIGASTTYTINVKASTTTSPGTVTLSCVTPLPTGVTCSFSPASLSPNTTGTNVTATVFTTLSTPSASTPITFRAATTSMLKQISATLQPTDFTFGVTPGNQVIPAPGGSTQYTVTMAALDGFNSAVTLSCTGLPAGWSCGFNPPSPTPTAGPGVTSTLTVTTAATPFGPANITVQGAAGSLVHSQQVTVTNGANDYQLVAGGPTTVAVRPGQTANYSVQLNRYGSFSASVAESCVYTSTTPAGVACNITPNPADLTTGTCPSNGLCQTASLQIPTNAATTAVGDYPLNFHGNGGASQHDLPLILRVNDFSISSSASPQTIQQANSATYNVTVTSLNNYGGTVALSCANFTSSGMSCSFSQNNFVPAAAGTSVTVTVSAAANATVANSQTFNVVASDGTTSHSVSLGYSTILVQDFTYSNSTVATQTVLPGQQAQYSTTLTPLNSFSANVNLSCSGLPANTTCSFNPVSPVAIGSATPQPVTVNINTTSTTPAGNATVTVTATDPVSGKTHAVTNLSLAVQSFTLTVAPTSRTIPPGSGTTFSVTVNAQNGLTQPVTLSCPAAPTGLTCTPPPPITPGSSGVMTVFAASSITTGTKALTISGTTGVGVPIVNQNVSVVISTTAASFTITDSVPSKSVAVGSAVSYSLVVRATTSVSPGAVTMSCVQPLPVGVTCTFSPATFTPTTTARTVTATVFTTSSTPAQSFPLQFQGTTTSQFKTSNFTLNVGDYTLGVTPPTQTIPSASGGSTQYTVTLTSVDSFASSVSLSCPGLPTGWTCGFAPSSVTPTGAGATSTLTLTTTNTPLGPTNITVQGSGGGLTHTQQVQVINGQDFTLSNGGPITVQQGGNNTVQINATAIGTFSASVALSCPSLQSGFTCGFVPASITPGTPSTLTISASGAVAGGQYAIAVQGQSSSPSLTHTTNVTVNVPDFSVGLNGASNIVIRGGSLQLSGTATSLGGFATSTTFNCSTGDANAPCVASSPVTPTAGGAAITVTVSPNGSATIGAHTVTLTGNDGAGHVHSATFGITVQDFSVGATDLNATVEAGVTTSSYSGTVTGLGGFTGNVTMSCSSSIALTCAFTPNPVAASGAGTAYTFTITPDPAAAVGGPYNVTVTGTGPGGATHTATVHVSVTATQDWSYTYQLATPQTQTVNAGQSATYNITLSPNNGFNSSVSLVCAVTGAPAGVGCGISGSPVAGGSGSITLTVTTTAGTVVPGTYDIVVTGTGGGKTRTTTAHLTVKDFTLTAGPTPQTVAPGGTADYTVGIATTSGFASTPTLACQILTAPAGASCSFDSTSVAPGSSTLMHVSSTNGTTPPGSYTVQVTATSGSTVHSVNVTYTVQNPVDFTLTTSTPSKTVSRGSFAAYSVTATAIGGFSSSVQLSCSGLPTGVTCSASTAFVPSATGTAKNVAVSASLSATPGTYNFTITGTGGGQTHSILVQLIVQ